MLYQLNYSMKPHWKQVTCENMSLTAWGTSLHFPRSTHKKELFCSKEYCVVFFSCVKQLIFTIMIVPYCAINFSQDCLILAFLWTSLLFFTLKGRKKMQSVMEEPVASSNIKCWTWAERYPHFQHHHHPWTNSSTSPSIFQNPTLFQVLMHIQNLNPILHQAFHSLISSLPPKSYNLASNINDNKGKTLNPLLNTY